MYQSDVRSMVNFLQLHQSEQNWEDYIFHDAIWEELYDLFCRKPSKQVSESKAVEPIVKWIHKITAEGGIMDIKTCIQRYFHYLITKQPHMVTSTVLSVAEELLHPMEIHEYMLPFFVYSLYPLHQQHDITTTTTTTTTTGKKKKVIVKKEPVEETKAKSKKLRKKKVV
jgi:hypothetical protein